MSKSIFQKLKSTLKPKSTKKTVEAIEETKIELPSWYLPTINREETENYLINKEIGVFIVRQSESQNNCFVLSVKVAKYLNANEVSHYLILQSSSFCFKLKGFIKEFSDLKSLVTHCSVVRDMLPVLLNLNYYNHSGQQKFHHDKYDNYMVYQSSTSSLVSMNSLSSLSSNLSY